MSGDICHGAEVPKKFDYKPLFKTGAVFHHCKGNRLFYRVKIDRVTYEFPVPISDIGDATFIAYDKANLFTRYIRQAIENNELNIVEQEFEYEVKCNECGRTFTHINTERLSPERIARGGLCRLCDDVDK